MRGVRGVRGVKGVKGIFMDSFQGNFKDGVTEGCYDCRYFSAVYLITRIMTIMSVVTYAVSRSAHFIAFSVIQSMMLVLAIVVIKPYKERLSVYGMVDVIFVLLIAMWSASLKGLLVAGTNNISRLFGIRARNFNAVTSSLYSYFAPLD